MRYFALKWSTENHFQICSGQNTLSKFESEPAPDWIDVLFEALDKDAFKAWVNKFDFWDTVAPNHSYCNCPLATYLTEKLGNIGTIFVGLRDVVIVTDEEPIDSLSEEEAAKLQFKMSQIDRDPKNCNPRKGKVYRISYPGDLPDWVHEFIKALDSVGRADAAIIRGAVDTALEKADYQLEHPTTVA